MSVATRTVHVMSDSTEEHTTHSTSPDGSTETETTEKKTTTEHTESTGSDDLGDGSPSGHAQDDGDSDTTSGGQPEDA